MARAFETYAHSFQVFPKLGLARISALLDALGNPQENLTYLHVAGTNGKGEGCPWQPTRNPECTNPPKQGYCVFGVTISSSRNVSPCVILKVDPGGNCPIMERLSNGFHESLANSK